MTTTESTVSDQGLPVLEDGPELAFRVARPVADGGTVSSFMPVGPWLNGPSGRPLAGALGVLIDNVLGCAIMLRRPPGGWSVSAEISLDLCGPVPDGTHVLRAEGRNDHSDVTGGIASCSVTDGSGRLIALGRQLDLDVAGRGQPARQPARRHHARHRHDGGTRMNRSRP